MLALSAPSNTNCLAPPNRTSRGGGVGVGKLRLPLSLVGGGAAGRTGAGEIDTGAGERFVAGGSGSGAGGRSVEGSTCTDGSEGAPPGEGSSARAARGPDATTAPTRSSLASKERKLFISLLSHGRFVSSVFISRRIHYGGRGKRFLARTHFVARRSVAISAMPIRLPATVSGASV